ncbi:MAG: hypothetical protein E6R08_09165 [Nevskiaceae bacterium]|nr:MAG: hypothetical protein E6R08_09165 [Nevskiaceae bacterium]
MSTGYEQPGDPAFEGGAAYERYCEEQARYRDEIIERCARAAELAALPSYGTHARHTGREEARKKIAATIRALKAAKTEVAL